MQFMQRDVTNVATNNHMNLFRFITNETQNKTVFYFFLKLIKSKKILFNVRQWKQHNISSDLKWVLVADD